MPGVLRDGHKALLLLGERLSRALRFGVRGSSQRDVLTRLRYRLAVEKKGDFLLLWQMLLVLCVSTDFW